MTHVPHSDYVLLDAGGGRQLERFGSIVVDRPFPAAVEAPRDPDAWTRADLRYERPSFGGTGWWLVNSGEALPATWTMRHEGLVFELRPTPTGQVGFFAEQIEPWRWLRSAIASASATSARTALSRQADPPPPISVLNLFAYTGGSTLAAAAAGASVTHLDSSRPALAWARRNADLSGLGEAPIRWIVDDALAFVEREARRRRQYQGLVLDPPSYGHGPKGEPWTLEDQLPVLLDACLTVMRNPAFVLLTAHAEGLAAADLGDALAEAFARSGRRGAAARIDTSPLGVDATSGARAPAGFAARWQARR